VKIPVPLCLSQLLGIIILKFHPFCWKCTLVSVMALICISLSWMLSIFSYAYWPFRYIFLAACYVIGWVFYFPWFGGIHFFKNANAMPFNLEQLLSRSPILTCGTGSPTCQQFPEVAVGVYLSVYRSSEKLLCALWAGQSMNPRKPVTKCSLENSIWGWSTLLAQLGYSQWLSNS
jgi:hypothetical protein